MRFDAVVTYDPAVDRWFEEQHPDLGLLARAWFDRMRGLGGDIREVLHDGHPTACIGDAALSYVNAFTHHVNVGFFLGAWLDDPAKLLCGTGKRMRHVKLRPHESIDEPALMALLELAYRDLQQRLRSGSA